MFLIVFLVVRVFWGVKVKINFVYLLCIDDFKGIIMIVVFLFVLLFVVFVCNVKFIFWGKINLIVGLVL